MGRYDEILARFMAFAEREPRILMGVQVGSGVRKDRPADAYTTQWVRKAFEIKPAKHSKTAPMKFVTGAVHF